MIELPLFPLNTVIFPGIPLNLHIFEDRYKEMIGMCIERRHPFGVVLIQKGIEALGPLAEPHRIGCQANIVQVQKLEQGRMNITAVGGERFRILSLDRNRPYLVGLVEEYPIEKGDLTVIQAASRRLQPWVTRYLEKLARLGEMEVEPQHMPQDPFALAYLSAYILQIPMAQKQDLLTVENAATLIENVIRLYRREIALIDALIERVQPDDDRTFSIN